MNPYTGEVKLATITIRSKYNQPDDLALIRLEKAIEDGAKLFVSQKKRKKKKKKKGRGKRKYECDGCGEWYGDCSESTMKAGSVWIASNKKNVRLTLVLIPNGKQSMNDDVPDD